MNERANEPEKRHFWRLSKAERDNRPFWGLPGQTTAQKLVIVARQIVYFSVAFGIYHYFTN